MSNPISRHPMMQYAQGPFLQGANVQLYRFHQYTPIHEGINIYMDYFERKRKGYVNIGNHIVTLELGVSVKDFVNEKISENPDYFNVFPPREVYDPSIRMYFSIVGLVGRKTIKDPINHYLSTKTLEEVGNSYFNWIYKQAKDRKQYRSLEENNGREQGRNRRGGARKSRRNNKSRRRSASKKNHRKHRR